MLPAGQEAQTNLVCSAKGCRREGVWALQWNNPRLHDEARRKTWLACDEHEPSLRSFLVARSFWRSTIPVSDL